MTAVPAVEPAAKPLCLQDETVFLHGDIMNVTYRCLQAKPNGGTVFADALAGKRVGTQARAEAWNIWQGGGSVDDVLDQLLQCWG